MSHKIPFKNEYILHRFTQKHLEELFGLKLLASEKQLNGLRVDNLAFDDETSSLVIIEYKNKPDFNVLSQVGKYHDEYKKLADDDFENIEIMIIGPEFSENQIKEARDNITFWQVSLFDEGKVEYENLKNGIVKTIEIDPDDLKITEEELLEDKSQKMRDLYFYLKENILKEFEDLKFRPMVNQFSIRADGKLICVIVFLKSGFSIYLYGESLESTNTIDISSKTTGGNANYKMKYRSNEDFKELLDLFKETYTQKKVKE